MSARSEVLVEMLALCDGIERAVIDAGYLDSDKQRTAKAIHTDDWRYLRALAIVGALHEHETARRVDMVSTIFDRLRSTDAPPAEAGPVGESAGADATDREEVDVDLVAALPPVDGSTSAPAGQPRSPLDGTLHVEMSPRTFADEDVASEDITDTLVRLAFMMDRQRERIRDDYLLVLQFRQLQREIRDLIDPPTEDFTATANTIAVSTLVVEPEPCDNGPNIITAEVTPELTSPSTDFIPSDEVAKKETSVPDDGLNPSFDPASAPEPFACSGCGKTFDTTSNLGRHRRFCVGLVTRNPAPAPVRPPAEPIGEYPCQYCDRVFPSQRALIGHQSFCAGAKAARLAKRQGARIPDPPAAALGPPEPVETTVDQIPPGMALLCSTCDTVYRNAAVLNSHTHRAHGRTATREERTPQRVEAVG